MSQDQLDQERLQALYKIFEKSVLEDQRNYYEHTITKSRTASSQVNRLRAFAALLTGLASALVGLIVSTNNTVACNNTCNLPTGLVVIVFVLLILAIVVPAIGGALGTLADLYQWDRLVTVYRTAVDSLEKARALAPDSQMKYDQYQRYLNAYALGTLRVMHDESAQWGQLIRSPEKPDLTKSGSQEDREAFNNFQAAVTGNRPDAPPQAPIIPPTVPVTPPPTTPPTPPDTDPPAVG